MGVHSRLIVPTVLAIGVAGTLSWASAMLDIGTVLANPETYQSQVVRVSGVVVNHKLRRSGANRCYQSFTVKDETGSIHAVHQANCSGAKNALRNRDLVTVDGRFEWAPGQSGLLKVQSVVVKVVPSAQ